MRRREAIVALAALGLPSLDARAQGDRKQYRVGVLLLLPQVAETTLPQIRERLAAQGFAEGRNLALDVGYAGTDPDAARNVIARKPDAILAVSTTAARAAQTETSTVPIVFVRVPDPLQSGLVKHLGRPGGNVTGISNHYNELMVKRLELLHDLLPSAKRVAVAANVADPTVAAALTAVKPAAARLGIELLARSDTGWNWDYNLDASIRAGAQAVCTFYNFTALGLRSTLEYAVQAVARRRIPTVWTESDAVEIGGLMAYAINMADELRQAVDVLARVLKGANPGTLAVEQVSRFEVAINLKTAKSLGLAIPRSVLLRANRVIE